MQLTIDQAIAKGQQKKAEDRLRALRHQLERYGKPNSDWERLRIFRLKGAIRRLEERIKQGAFAITP